MEERTIALGRGAIAAKVWGPEGGRKVLALHGWLDNAATYDALAPHLPEVRLVAIDLPGHGRSGHQPPGHPYAFIDYVAAVAEIVDALGWSSCALMGHSLGAGIAAVYAGTFASRVERLVLIEGLGPLTETVEGTPARLARALTEERHKRERNLPVYPSVDAVASRLQSMNALPPESARRLLERGLREVDGGVTWRSDARLRWASRLRLTEGQVLAFLRAITAPTLVVRASEGFRLSDEVTNARMGALAHASVVDLVGHHHIHCERPAEVGAAIAPFLR